MSEARCGSCMFFKPEPDVENDGGDCHRYAPRPMVGVQESEPMRYVDWPKMSAFDWCGEWKAQELTQGQSAQ